MIKLRDILNEIKVNKPGRIPLYVDPEQPWDAKILVDGKSINATIRHNGDLYIRGTADDYFDKHYELFDKHNIKYGSRTNKPVIKNWEKYFEVVEKEELLEIKVTRPAVTLEMLIDILTIGYRKIDMKKFSNFL